MAIWAGCAEGTPTRVLDVGCGIGGASRHLAKGFGPDTSVTGITLSQKQAERANALAAEQGVPNASFLVMDALAMNFPDNTFDLVWACESGEHMPDKRKYVEEMVRVLKPGDARDRDVVPAIGAAVVHASRTRQPRLPVQGVGAPVLHQHRQVRVVVEKHGCDARGGDG